MRPMTLADVLDGMFRLFIGHWRTYLMALGVIVVPQSFVTALAARQLGTEAGLLEQFNNPAAAQAAFQAGPDMTAVVIFAGIAGLLALFLTPYLTGVGCRIAGEAYEGGDPQPGEVLRSTLRRYGALLGVIFLQALVFLLIFALPIGIVVAGVTGGDQGLVVGGVILALFILPAAIWLGIRLALATPVVMMEGAGVVAALKRSYELVEGRWWRVFGTLLLAQIITGIVAQIASLPFSIPGELVSGWIAVVFTTLGGVLAGVVTTPLAANAQTLLYYDGRIRSEGYDLEQRFNAPPPPPRPAQPFA